MRWFVRFFDLLCIVVAVTMCWTLYHGYDNQNEQPLQPVATTGPQEQEVDIAPEVALDKSLLEEIEYYNEASVGTESPVFQGLVRSSSGGPEILIYHTHTSETYRGDKGSVVDVGALLADLLRAKGYRVLHDVSINDSDYNMSYETAYCNVEKILNANPSIQCIIDVHRDSATKNMVVEDQGIQYAKMMLVVGTNVRLANAGWRDNLSFAKAIHVNCMERVQEIIKPIYLSVNRYNQHMCENSVIVEVGGLENTLNEALNATYILAEAIDSTLKGK